MPKSDYPLIIDTNRFSKHFGKKRPEHVVIAERALGQQLPKNAQVHHVNENKLDNHPENLVICPDGAYHALLHRREKSLRVYGDVNALKAPKPQKKTKQPKERVTYEWKGGGCGLV